MSKRMFWCVLLTVPLLIEPERAQAVEYGELVQKDGKWVFKNTEDPIFKLMRDRGLITDERYYAVSWQSPKNRIESADAILINNRKEYEWNRYLKTALRLPDWVDLGLENRTRFESYDHPWRTSQADGNGRTDAQIPLRSRLRFGLGNGPFRFLFEGQDARSFSDQDPGSFRNNTTVNAFDILQLFGSLTLKNTLGSGLRIDFHFGRWTSDFGRRRLIARSNFRNASTAFDGFHWQISREKLWRLRVFVVEPVVRDEEQLDEQNSKMFFWGTYFQSYHLPWFQIDAYYLGLNDKLTA